MRQEAVVVEAGDQYDDILILLIYMFVEYGSHRLRHCLTYML